MKPILRIHIAALGYLSDRVHIPAVEQKADKVYLLRYPQESRERSKKALKDIRKHLKVKKIELQEIACDIFDLPKIVKVLKEIIQKEKKNNIYLNISSGNKKTSSAFTISAMLFRDQASTIVPFYAGFDYDKMETDVSNIKSIPVFHIRTPNNRQCIVLKLLRDSKEPLRKSQILGHIDPKYNSTKNRKYRCQKLMSLNRTVIDKLKVDWDMIKIKGRGKGTTVRLTQKGKDFSEFLD